MRAQDADRKRTHPEGYVEQVKNLPENVRFIANSQETKRRLLAIGIDDHRIQVKYLGVEMPPEPPSELRASKTPRFLYLGRLVDCKGPDLVIRAFEQACDDGMDGTLTLAGDGPLRLTCELMRARSPHADRITIAGAVDRQMGERLRNEADIFCAHNCLGPISLQEEAFGVSFIEAMASGLPVVSARSGSLPEVVEDGKQGILVEPGDVRGQATAFIRLANDPLLRSRMGREGWERARRLFSVRQEIDRLREILSLP
jgi:glycosyltransferase involved in cell wall biosynthesis